MWVLGKSVKFPSFDKTVRFCTTPLVVLFLDGFTIDSVKLFAK